MGLGPADRSLGAALGVLVACLLMGSALVGLASQSKPAIEKALAGSTRRPYLLDGMQGALAAVPQRCKEELGVAVEQLRAAGKTVAEDLANDGVRTATQGFQTMIRMSQLQGRTAAPQNTNTP